jgi:hypothetical protein
MQNHYLKHPSFVAEIAVFETWIEMFVDGFQPVVPVADWLAIPEGRLLSHQA